VFGAAPALAARRAGAPRPIPGDIQPFGPGTEVFHVFFPGTGEPNNAVTCGNARAKGTV